MFIFTSDNVVLTSWVPTQEKITPKTHKNNNLCSQLGNARARKHSARVECSKTAVLLLLGRCRDNARRAFVCVF